MESFLAGLLGAALLYLLSLFLSAAHGAYLYFPKPALEELEERDREEKRVEILLELLAHRSRLVLILRFTTIAVRVLFISILVLLALRLGGGSGMPVPVILLIHFAVATLLIGSGEMISRSLGIQHSEKIALTAARTVRLLEKMVNPLLSLLMSGLKRGANRFGLKRVIPYLTVEELIAVVEVGEGEGEIEEEEREMIHSIFELSDTTVREVMVPRVDMVAVERSSPIRDALEKITKEGHSRIPVYEGGVDKIVGVVYAKDLLRIAQGTEWDLAVGNVMREPFFVPEGKIIDDLLREFRQEKVHLAIVVDEYGGTAGLVTLEDVLEEIVGEIQDEYDRDDLLFEADGPDAAVVNAKISIDELNERLRINLPADRHETLGGYLYDLVDRVPLEGETFDEGGLDFRVERVDRQRISRVRVRKRPPPRSSEPEEHSESGA